MDNPRTSNTSRVRSSGVPIDTNQLFNFVSPGPASTFTKGVPTNTTFTTLPPTGLNVRSQHRRDDLASLLKAAPTFDNLRSSANGASTSLSKVGDKLMVSLCRIALTSMANYV